MSKRDNGDGTLFQRKDGRWCARAFVTLPNGEIKRLECTRKNRSECKARLDEWLDANKKNLPTYEKAWTVGSYMRHWLDDILPGKIKLSSRLSYERIAVSYIIPAIGRIPLKDLSVTKAQEVIDYLYDNGTGGNTIKKFQCVLSACLSRAMKEEIVFRNVARLVDIPKYTVKKVAPWTLEQSQLFLQETMDSPFHLAYSLMLTYGMRKGEVTGLRWCDIDFDGNRLYIRQQVGRCDGEMRTGDTKTSAGRRDVYLTPEIKTELLEYAVAHNVTIPPFQHNFVESLEGIIICTENGNPVEASNFNRTFHREREQLGLPRITMHALRHTAATLLKNLGVPIKDVQLILGHANISTTLAIYQHGDEQAQNEAVMNIGKVLNGKQTLRAVI